MLTLFTDGSWRCHDRNLSGGAYLVLRGGTVLDGLGIPLGPVLGANSTELRAAISGLDSVLRNMADGEDILLVSDSRYLVGGLSSAYLPEDRHSESLHKTLWRTLYGRVRLAQSRGSRLYACWIKGHRGNKCNSLCDKMARKAAVKQLYFRPVEG